MIEMIEYPLAIRDVPPGSGFTRIVTTRPDGIRDGVHTGGAWLSPDGMKVWKPLDGRPWLNSQCHVPTRELECLEMMGDAPGFPRNWTVQEAGEVQEAGQLYRRRWLVRDRAWIVSARTSEHTPARLPLDYVLSIERGLRLLSSLGWEVNDLLQVGVDRRGGRPFIVDLSNAAPTRQETAFTEEEQLYRWFEQMGYSCLVRLRRAGHAVFRGAWRLVDPDPTWPRPAGGTNGRPDLSFQHVYAASRILSPQAQLSDCHIKNVVDGSAPSWVKQWVVTRHPLEHQALVDLGLVWAWAPVPLDRTRSGVV